MVLGVVVARTLKMLGVFMLLVILAVLVLTFSPYGYGMKGNANSESPSYVSYQEPVPPPPTPISSIPIPGGVNWELSEEEKSLALGIALSDPLVSAILRDSGGWNLTGYSVVTRGSVKVGVAVGFKLVNPVWFSGSYVSLFRYREYDLRAFTNSITVYVDFECNCVKGYHLSEYPVSVEEAFKKLDERERRLLENAVNASKRHPLVRKVLEYAELNKANVTILFEGLYYKPLKAIILSYEVKGKECANIVKVEVGIPILTVKAELGRVGRIVDNERLEVTPSCLKE